MCLSPINIRNNRRFFRPTVDKYYNLVPCGTCPECVQRAQDDMFVRAYYEFYKVIKDEHDNTIGTLLFPTLTYNDRSLPTLDLSDPKFNCLLTFADDVPGSNLLDVKSKEVQYVDKSTGEIQTYNEIISKKFRTYYEKDSVGNTHILSCFKKTDVQKFIKRFRTLCSDRLFITQDIKYFCVTEYGGDYHRPHYHLLLFIPKVLTDKELLDIQDIAVDAWSDKVTFDTIPADVRVKFTMDKFECNDNYTELVYGHNGKDTREYVFRKDANRHGPLILHRKGFVSYSREFGPTVKNINNVRYLMKYLAKDSNYMDIPYIKEFFAMSKLLPSSTLLESMGKHGNALKTACYAVKESFPFHLQSKGFGSALYDELNTPDLSDEKKQTLINNSLSLKENTKTYSIPQYVINKLFYKYDTDPITEIQYREVTPLGLEILQNWSKQQISRLTDLYKNFISVYEQFLTPEDLTAYEQKYHISYSYLRECLLNKFGTFDCSYHDLAIYQLFYRNVSQWLYKNYFWDSICSYADFADFADSILYEKFQTFNDRKGKCLDNTEIYAKQRLVNNFFNKHQLYSGYTSYDSKGNVIDFFPSFDDFINGIDYLRKKVHQRIFANSQTKKEEKEDFLSIYHKYFKINYYVFQKNSPKI